MLLLAVQQACNVKNVAVPWDDIGRIMGPQITGGAVIQHLAKLRIRMVAQDLPVPPPLRRGGGGSRISTTVSSSGPKVNATKKGSVKDNPTSTKSKPMKSKKAGKRSPPGSDDSGSESDSDAWKDDDSDAEFGEHRAKREKANAKVPMKRKFKVEDSDEEVDIPTQPPKRKHKKSKSNSRHLSAYGTTDINGVPIDYESDSEDDNDAELVGAGESWLDLEDDYVSRPKTGTKTPYKKKSLVVSLPLISSKMGMIETIKEEEEAGGLSDDAIEDEVVGGDFESHVDGSYVLGNENMGGEIESHVDGSYVLGNENMGGEIEINVEGSYVLGNENMGHGFSISPYNNEFSDLAAAQLDLASHSTAQNGTSINAYPVGPQISAEGLGLYEQSSFADEFVRGCSEHLDEEYGEDIEYHNTSGYQFMDNGFAGAGGMANVPYPVQTSWPAYADSSQQTSMIQTPADTSAGTDFGTGYFNNDQFDPGSFDNANIDFSANDGADTLFNAEDYDGNFVGGGFLGHNFYGN